MALDGVSWVRGGLVETALAARGLAVRQNRRRPLLPPSGHAPPWELVSASVLRRFRFDALGRPQDVLTYRHQMRQSPFPFVMFATSGGRSAFDRQGQC